VNSATHGRRGVGRMAGIQKIQFATDSLESEERSSRGLV